MASYSSDRRTPMSSSGRPDASMVGVGTQYAINPPHQNRLDLGLDPTSSLLETTAMRSGESYQPVVERVAAVDDRWTIGLTVMEEEEIMTHQFHFVQGIIDAHRCG